MAECTCYTVECSECTFTRSLESPVPVEEELQENYKEFMDGFFNTVEYEGSFTNFIFKVQNPRHANRIRFLFDRGIISKYQWVKLCLVSEEIREIVLLNLEKKYGIDSK